jgi:hypothetical protein
MMHTGRRYSDSKQREGGQKGGEGVRGKVTAEVIRVEGIAVNSS